MEFGISPHLPDRVVYTNRKQLLYGDFFIDVRPCKDFLGTGIAFGSDEFKTWEESDNIFQEDSISSLP